MFGKPKKLKVEEIDNDDDFEKETDPDQMLPVTGEKIYWDDWLTEKNFLERVKSKYSVYKSRIWHAYYDVTAGFTSLWKWRKIIWKDRPWGNHQILDILIFKIKMDALQIYKNQNVEGSDVTHDEMMRVATLLQRYQDDEYFTEYRKKHDEKWGEDRHYFVELKSGNYEWKSERDDRLSKEDLEKEKEEYNELRDKARQERADDLKEALKIMQEKLDEWWD